MVVIPHGFSLLLPPKIDIISFGNDDVDNDIFYENEIFIPKPDPVVSTQRKGKTISGKDCFCIIENDDTYLPPERNEECICKKNCCKRRGKNEYLPPTDCEICPKCTCDRKTFTLINVESGDCPILCR